MVAHRRSTATAEEIETRALVICGKKVMPDADLATFYQVTTFNYDALNRKTLAGFGTQAGPTYQSTISYTYDAGNRLTQAVDSVSGTINLGYDGLNRLTSESTPQGSIAYTYDNAGRRTSMTVAGQTAVNYSYDNDSRLSQITQGSSTVGFIYDNGSRRATLTLPNGVVMTYSYDQASELGGITYKVGTTTLGDLSYTYDGDGRRATMGGSLAQTGLPQVLSSATYDAANELTQWDATNLTYDANGNLTADDVNTYTWNARNQLSLVKDAGTGTTLANFQYDAFGRRIENAAGDGVLYDGVNAVQELSGATPVVNRLTGGVDEFFGRTDSGGTTFPLTDALGSTIALTDSSGAIQTQYSYEPFGATTPTGATSSNWYQFTGRENDGTGLYYYRARYYSPRFQRFISEDPLGFGGGDPNLYGYVRESPADFADPGGNTPVYSLPGSAASPTSGRKDNKCYTLSCYAKNVAIGVAAGLGFAGLPALAEAASGMGAAEAEGIPTTLVRVIPKGIPPTMLGRPEAVDVFVTTPEAIEGLDANGIAQRLSIPESPSGYHIIQFPTPDEGLASPIFRPNPDFVGGGKTGGGAPEFVIPNGPIPAGASIRVVQ